MHYTELKNTFTGRCIAFLIVVYLIIVPVQRAKAEVTSTTLTLGMAAAAATALGSSAYVPSGLAAAAAPAATAIAIGTFAIAFCGTSYVMGTGLCDSDPAKSPSTGGTIGSSLITSAYVYDCLGIVSNSMIDACTKAAKSVQDSDYAYFGDVKIDYCDSTTCYGHTKRNSFAWTPNRWFTSQSASSADVGRSILSSAVATAGMAAAATSLARGSTYQAAVAAAKAAAEALKGNASSNNAGVDAAIAAYQSAKNAGKSDADALAAANSAGLLAGLTAAQVNAAVSAYKSSYTSAASVNAAASAFQSQLMTTTMTSAQINTAVNAYRNALTQGKSQADAYAAAMSALQSSGMDITAYSGQANKYTSQAAQIQHATAQVDAQTSIQSQISQQKQNAVSTMMQVYDNSRAAGASVDDASKIATDAAKASGLTFDESVAALRAYLRQVNTVTDRITQQRAAISAVADVQANNTKPQAAVIGADVGAAVADKETASDDYKAGADVVKPDLNNPNTPAGAVPNSAIGSTVAGTVQSTAVEVATSSSDKAAQSKPETKPSDKSLELPEFCDYAKVVCDFVDWTKQEYKDVKTKVTDYATDDTVTEEASTKPVEENDTTLLNDMQSVNFGGSAYCPADIAVPLNFQGLGSSSLKISYGPLCTLAEKVRPVVIMIAWILAAYIVTGRNMKESEA